MTTELQQQSQSFEELQKEKLSSIVNEFKKQVDLVVQTNDFKRKLELMAHACYLVAGIQTLAGLKKFDSLVVHERNMGRVTPELEEWLTKTKKLLSDGALSISNRSLPG